MRVVTNYINSHEHSIKQILLFSNFVGSLYLKPLLHEHLVTPLKYKVYENIMKNGAFAPLEQMLHFP